MSQKKRQIKNMTPSTKSKAYKKTVKEPSTGGLGIEGVSTESDLEGINTETHKSKSYVGSISYKSKKFNSVDKSRPSSCTTQTTYSEMSDDQDILILTLSEITQKIVHCQIGQDLFIDIPWCNVKKKDILEDISIQDTNSPFYKIMGKIMAYKHEELLMGYEPLGSEENQFYLCITENGRNEVLQRLEHMRLEYIKKIQASKEIKPRPWKSLGSESEVDLFQVKNTRALISLEWIGEVAKRCHEPVFSDLDADEKNNTYTSLLPKKEKPDLIFMKTQDTGSQAVPTVKDLEVQTVPEIPTNENTQCATEAEIAVVEQVNNTEKSQDLNAFFEKYINFLTDILHYNEVYDLYKDDYPALATFAKDAQVQQHSAYRQYQSFTDVAAIEGKLVISSSWHPNYTGIVAVAYANVIPCKTHELEYDSDQADYEEEKTDESDKEKSEGEEYTLGNKKWLEEEKAEKETKEENTEFYDKATKKLKDIEATKRVWDVKVMDGTDEIKRETLELDSEPTFEYIEHPVESESQTEQELKHSVDVEIIDIEDGITEEYKKSSDSLVDDRYLDSFIQRSSVSIERGLKSPSIMSEQSAISEASKYGKLATKLTKHKHQIHSISSRKDKNKQRFQKYLGRDYYSATSLISRKTSLVSSLAYSSIDTGERFFGDQEKDKFEEVTDDEELKDDEEELPYLEPNNPVLIWSFVDDLTPKLRLDSPYEVTCVEFCPHNGNILAGGTVSGQVVVWDITGRIEELEQPETLTPQQQKHKKVMEYLMDWRRDTRSRRRVRPCVISNYDVSHNDKITSLSWITPFLEVSRFGEVEPVTSQMGFSLQVVTSGLEGEIKIWDLKSDPLKKSKKQVRRRNDTVERYGRPTSLDKGISPFSKLYRQWNPLLTLKLTHGHASVMLTGVAPTSGLFTHNRVTSPLLGVKETLENRVEYTLVSPKEAVNMSRHFFISTAFGHPGNVEWEIMDKEAATASEGPITPSIDLWKTIHDAPITRIVRHPFFSDICLTVGGHMFAIWHLEDREYPIMSKRYYGVRITDGLWSPLRPSLIRIARSDGIVEIWDLLLQSHAPANKIIVSGKIVTNMSSPCLPEVYGLLGIADYNSAFRLFYIPRQFRVYNMDELAEIKDMFNKEPPRRRKMREWSKWWRENEVNSDRQMKKREGSQAQSNEEGQQEEEKIKESQKKYKEEVYKWYSRRRGKSFLGTEEAEEKWRYKQEKHMHEVIMQKKKVDLVEMEKLMRPLVKEKKNEALKMSKVLENIKQADIIFRSTVSQILPRKIKVKDIGDSHDNLEATFKTLDQYFGDGFKELATEQLDMIEAIQWSQNLSFSELTDKYNALRMYFNDRRRKRSKTSRWLRKKLKEEFLKEGLKIHVRKSHKDRYETKKIKKRKENLQWLKETYGDDYDINWDKKQPCRKFGNKKVRVRSSESMKSKSTEFEQEDDILSQGSAASPSRQELITHFKAERDGEVNSDIKSNFISQDEDYDHKSSHMRSISTLVDYKSKYLELSSKQSTDFGDSKSNIGNFPQKVRTLPSHTSFMSAASSVEPDVNLSYGLEMYELEYIAHANKALRDVPSGISQGISNVAIKSYSFSKEKPSISIESSIISDEKEVDVAATEDLNSSIAEENIESMPDNTDNEQQAVRDSIEGDPRHSEID